MLTQYMLAFKTQVCFWKVIIYLWYDFKYDVSSKHLQVRNGPGGALASVLLGSFLLFVNIFFFFCAFVLFAIIFDFSMCCCFFSWFKHDISVWWPPQMVAVLHYDIPFFFLFFFVWLLFICKWFKSNVSQPLNLSNSDLEDVRKMVGFVYYRLVAVSKIYFWCYLQWY